MTKQHGPWTIKETARKFENEFIQVDEDKVVRPDGEAGAYATVKMKQGISVLPVDSDGFVYLTRQFRYAVGRESIETVSGGVDEGESTLEAAKREASEEVGIEADEWIDLGMMDIDTSIINAPAQQFLARGLRFTEAERDGTEAMETIKVSFAEAVKMVLDGRITHGPSSVLILKAQEHLRIESENNGPQTNADAQ